MNKSLKILGLASATVLVFSLSVRTVNATVYSGNGKSSFDGAVGNGVLTLTSNGTTLSGTITNGSTTSGFNDTLVIYIDSVTGGFTSTSTLTDSGTPADSDNLRASISGFNGTTRAPLNFATGFGADYAIAIGPTSANFGALYMLSSASGFTYGTNGSNGGINFTPSGTGSNTSATYTFSLPLSLLGSPSSFKFTTTYLSGGTATGGSAYRSNEALGNTISDTTNTANTGSIGQDTASATFVTFSVPEPGSWVMILSGVGMLIGLRSRWRRV